MRPVTFGRPVTSPGRGGAKNATDANGSAGSSSRLYAARASSSSRAFGASRNSRSSPLTEKTSAFALVARAPSTPDRNSEWSRKSAKLVLVATPEMPLIDTCAPRVPSRKSRSTYTGMPSRPSPTVTLRSIRSKQSARSRSLSTARRTTAPGHGGTYTSGSARVVAISAASCTWAGSTPSATRNTSEANVAPSCRARTSVTTPAISTGPTAGTSRVVTTTSSSCSADSGPTATQNFSGVASSVPSTRPTASVSSGPLIPATQYGPGGRPGGHPRRSLPLVYGK